VPDWGKVWPTSSVRLNISYIYLPVEGHSVRQFDMKQDSPVAAHVEVECTLITAWLYLSGIAKDRTHSRMRHITLQRNMRTGQPFTAMAGQSHGEDVWTDPRMVGIALTPEIDIGWNASRLGATFRLYVCQHEQNEKTEPKSSVPNHQAASPLQSGNSPLREN
jgi:hypothetical protein